MKKNFSLFLFFLSIYNYYIFFNWYLSDQKIIIEDAMFLALNASISLYAFIFITHIYFFPKNVNESAKIITFPPLILLFSINTGLLIGTTNMYYLQLYEISNLFNILRSKHIGVLLIIISLFVLFSALNEFKRNNEDPMPTTKSKFLILTKIYKFTRNPMYLGMLIFQFGLGMSLSFIHIVFLTPITFYIFHKYIIIREEQYLEKKFGMDYQRYKSQVRRWL
tara:strand:+ start:155 stop:820 length:666 start_codon:yes stop_codon:yes gene_type:complete